MLTRGSSAVYLVDTSADDVAHAVVTTAGSEAFTTTGTGSTAMAAGDPFFVNGRGPMVASAVVNAAATSITVGNTGTGFNKFFPRAVAAIGTDEIKWPVMKVDGSGNSGVTAGAVLLLDGRRYRVRARGTGAGIDGASKITLAENYAGGSLEKVCDTCVAVSVAGSLKTWDNAAVGSGGAEIDLAVGDTILQEDEIHGDKLTTVATVTSKREFVTSKGGAFGTSLNMGADVAANADTGGKALYKTRYGALGAPTVSLVAESSTGARTYNYVAQCSNRGTCDGAIGICKCFKGYAGDNCAKQNMLAM
jgi:hypothetical protein